MTALFVALATVLVASPAMAAPVYEITARWADGSPTQVASGDVVSAEWRVNVNDDAEAPSNDPVDDVNFTLTLQNGVFTALPDSCVAGGDPASAISEDGKTLVCNLGTQPQGSAHVLQTPVRADGDTGDQITGVGTIGGNTAALDPIEIVNVFGMDIAWGTPTPNFVIGNGFADLDFQWTLFLRDQSEPGPDSMSYTVNLATANGSAISITPGAACTPFTTGAATGHPWSGGDHPDAQTSPFAGSCTLTPTGTPGQFTMTLTGIDYSLENVPTLDSVGRALRVDADAVASGQISIRVATTTNTGVTLSTNAPTYTAPGSGATVTDDPTNNASTKTITFPGGMSASYVRATTGDGGTVWDDSYRVSPGTEVHGQIAIDTQNPGYWPPGGDPAALYGVCEVIDTRYATYTRHDVRFISDQYPTQYYVGTDPLVDPASASYDPDAFSCATGGNSQIGGNGWVTTKPADLSTIKAVRVVYPFSETKVSTQREGVFVFSKINADAPAGIDVWTWGAALVNGTWTDWRVSAPQTPTPDARYPGTTSLRDVLRVVTVTPNVLKSVDRSVVRPGEPATFTLIYSANGDGAVPASVDGYILRDILPAGVSYVAGSAAPEPVIGMESGRQVLTWTLDDVPTNTQVPLSYRAVADSSVVPGQPLVNTVAATYGEQTRSASARVTVSTAGYTTIGKTADSAFIPNLGGDGVGEGSWTVTLRSFDPLPQEYTDTIDILPFNGDERGTEFSGEYTLTGVDAAPGATVYYTTADPSTISDDPADVTNGAAGTVDGNTIGWTTTFTPDATAVRVIGGELAPGAIQQFTVNVATDDVEGGDVLVNRAQARDGHTELVMRTSAPIMIANYYSASLKKYVQDAEGEWRDANTVEDYPSFSVGDTIRYRIVVENTGQGTLTGIEISDDQQPELGSFIIDELAPGDSDVHEYEIVADAATGDGVVNTACAAADIPEDSGVAPTINCDPAGFEVEGEPTHTKSIVSAEPIGGGQWEIVYELEVVNSSTASTSYSLADELHFTDQVDIASAAVTDSPDGVTLADPAWDGQGNLDVATDVPLLGSDDDGYAPHTYLLTVVADVPLQFAPGGDLPATECAAEGEDTETAFNNTSELTLPSGDVEPNQACATPPEIDIDKSVSSGPTPNDDGTWTVTYDLVATNTGGVAAEYDISDRMTASGDMTGESGQITSAPDGVTVNDSWTGEGAEGSAENIIASGISLPAGSTHTYQVEVVISLAEGTAGAPVITECSEIPADGDGLSNSVEIEHNDLTADDSACVTVGIVTVEKSVAAGPTPNGDGTWTVVYDIVATHAGGAAADYDVTDRLHFGEGIEIVDREVRSLDGIDVNPSWTGNGAADSDAENIVAEGITLGIGESHTYQVEVTVEMDESTIDPTALQCAPGAGDAGGLGNSTTLTSNGVVGEDTVCPSVPLIKLDKTIVEGSPVANGDGTWTIAYDVSASNVGQAPGDYDLSDRLMYGEGLDVQEAAIVDGPADVTPNAGWTGQGAEGAAENVIVTDQPLDAGETHTFRVDVIATMDRSVVTPDTLECPAPGETGGFANTAELEHNGEDQNAAACVPPPLIEIDKSLSGAVVPVEGEDGVYDATYELTVTNSGPGAGVYDLDDQLAPGEGVTVVGVQDISSDVTDGVAINDGFNGVDDVRIVTEQAIGGADGAPVVHTYTVVVRYAAELSGIELPTGEPCTSEGGEALPGTLNNTATVGWNGLDDADAECIVPGKPTLDKAIVSATPIGGGQWEVVYDLTVGNTGNEATTYDLDDELLFAPQISVDSITVDGPAGIAINDGFDGDADQRIATDVNIIGLDDDGYAPHVYRVTVIANVPLTFDDADAANDGTGSPACTAPPGGNFAEQGLNNAATLTDENGGTIVDTDCAQVPSTKITKTMDGDPVAGGDGRWTVNYTITVLNDGAAAGPYTLTDQLRYGTGITVIDATVTEAPEGVTPAATWTGLGDAGAVENVVASDVSLAAGGTHTYRVVVETHLDTDTADATAITCPEPGSGDRGGFSNTAGVNHNGLTADAAACAVPEWPEDVPPPLAITGGEISGWVLATALILLAGGGVLMIARRRRVTESVEADLIS